MDSLLYINKELLILIPFLYIVGLFIKLGITKIPNRYIPFILLGISLCICFIKENITVDTVIQGVLIAGTSVFGNEIVNKFIDVEKLFNNNK